jgi:hypothetical protein
MSHQGLMNLFEGQLTFDRIEIDERCLPVWSLSWILRKWADGLQGHTREDFLQMKVQDLIAGGALLLNEKFVTELPDELNRELAYATILFARKGVDK